MRLDENRHLQRRPNRMPFLFLVLGLVGGWLLANAYAQLGTQGKPMARPITPRGGFTDTELADINLFQETHESIVYIRSIALQRGMFSMEEVEGTGSGFVWDTEGHIVTNYHVIKDATSADIVLADGSTWEARFVGAARDKDLAVLKIDAPANLLKPITIGTSDDLVEGQTVYAIGNPFGLDHSLTKGIISALDRTMTSVTGQTIYGVIQTDAAINPGNSGGTLLDSAGRLIGVNTAIKSATRSSAGIGFAVPVDTVNHLVPQLITYGGVVVPELGATYIDDRITRGQLRRAGVMVESVTPGGGAEEAGLIGVRRLRNGRYSIGDIITAIDGKPITKRRDLEATLADYAPGAEVQVTFIRDDELRTTSIVLERSQAVSQ